MPAFFSGDCTAAFTSSDGTVTPLTLVKMKAIWDGIPKIEPPQQQHCQNCKVDFGGLITPQPVYLGAGPFAPVGAYVCGHCWYKLKQWAKSRA